LGLKNRQFWGGFGAQKVKNPSLGNMGLGTSGKNPKRENRVLVSRSQFFEKKMGPERNGSSCEKEIGGAGGRQILTRE